MDWNKERTEFPTMVHRLIYLTALRQISLDVSLADTQTVSPELVKSCKVYYEFIMDMLSDMFDDPDKWGMNPGVYDAFLDGKKENAMKRIEKNKTLKLRSITYNSVQIYYSLLFNVGKNGILDHNNLLLSSEYYQGLKTAAAKNKSIIENSIPFDLKINAFRQIGLCIDELPDGSAVIQSQNYPRMLLAMSELAKSAEGIKTYGEFNFKNCEFRQIWDAHKPNYEDMMDALPEQQKAVIDTIRAAAKRLGLRESCVTYWKVDYHYKGKHVMCIDSDTDWQGEKCARCNNVRIRVNGAHTDSYTDHIAAKGDEFVAYFMRHLNYCTACSTSHIGWQRELFGRRVRLCCEPHFRIVNPGTEDLENIEEFIKLRMEEIRLEKGNG